MQTGLTETERNKYRTIVEDTQHYPEYEIRPRPVNRHQRRKEAALQPAA